jgi:hypothetical protein
LAGFVVAGSGCAGIVGADFDGLRPRSTEAGASFEIDTDSGGERDDDASFDPDASTLADVPHADAPPTGTDRTPAADADASEEEGGASRGSIIVSPTRGLITSERGRADGFFIVLGTKPASNVVIALSIEPDTGTLPQVRLGGDLVTFTPTNWNARQDIWVLGLDDPTKDGDQILKIITHPAQSDDPAYAGLDPADVEVMNVDDETAGISLWGRFRVTSESGTVFVFQLALNSPPTADVVVDLVSANPQEATVSPPSVTFGAADWSRAQTITVTGVDDAIADGPQENVIVTMPAKSSDPNYNGVDPENVSMINLDNDVPGVTFLSGDSMLWSQGGEPVNHTCECADDIAFDVVLNLAPTADVTIGFSSDNTREGVVMPSTLTFTPLDWNKRQQVWVRAVDDLLPDGNQLYTIVTSKAVSADKRYDGLDVPDLPLSNWDDENPAGL